MSHRSHSQAASSQWSASWVIISLVAVMLLAVGLLIALSPPSAQSQTGTVSNSVLTAPELSYDFGDISMAEGRVTKVFRVSNTTASAITARKLFTSCMCTSATLIVDERRVGPFGMEGHGGPIPTINEEIPSGGGAVVEVTFDPAAHGPAGVGPIARSVFLETADGKKLVFGIKAQVRP